MTLEQYTQFAPYREAIKLDVQSPGSFLTSEMIKNIDKIYCLQTGNAILLGCCSGDVTNRIKQINAYLLEYEKNNA